MLYKVDLIFKKANKLLSKVTNSKNSRTDNIKKNIIGSLSVKGASILINLIMVPILINYLSPTKYGIWLALTSVIMWFGFFDIGFGNGLRNKFAEVKSMGQFEEARRYISTTYAILTIIFLSVWIFFFIINYFIDWSVILNTPKDLAGELSILALVVFSFLSMQIVLKTLTTTLIADQKPAKAGLIDMLGQLLGLIIILIVANYMQGSLLLFGFILSFSPVLILILASLWFYSTSLYKYRPSFNLICFPYAKNILRLGLKFFVIQIAFIVIYQTNNIIITQVSGPKNVVIYNVALKYFTIASMIFSVIITPFWSSFTEAYIVNDYIWMNRMFKKLQKTAFLFFLLVLILLTISRYVYQIWIGDSLEIDFIISLGIAIYIITNIWNSLHSYILNGIGKIKLQLLISLLGIIFYIPFAFFLGQKYGIVGVIIAGIILNIISAIYAPIQVKKILAKEAIGIWNE